MRIARRNLALGALLAGLVALQLAGPRGAGPTREVVRLFPELVPAEAATFTLRGAGREVRAERREDGWVLPELFDHPADEKLLTRVLERLAALTTLDLLSDDPARHAGYGLDEAAAQRVTVTAAPGADGGAGATVAEVFVARSAQGTAYVRAVGSDAVYGAGALPATPSDVQSWRLPAPLLRVDPTLVTRVELELAQPDGVRRLDVVRDPRQYRVWRDGDGRELRNDLAEALVREVVTLFPQRVVAGGPEPAHGLEEPVVSLRVLDEKGNPARAVVGAIQDVDGPAPWHAAQGALGPWVVAVRATAVERLRAAVAALAR